MNDDYLWDGSGQPDPEVRRLEELLKPFRYSPIDAQTGSAAAARTGMASFSRRKRIVRRLSAAAAIAAAVLLCVLGLVGGRTIWRWLSPAAPGWQVVALTGGPTIASERLGGSGMLPVGQWIETDAASRAEVKVGLIGTALLEPNTRARLLKASATEHRLGLERGTLHARIWAPPRLFYVETPSAVAVDLGCAYTITVDESGGSLIRVEAGWVAFEDHGRESFVPEGAVCATRAGSGPGTPYYEDAPLTLVEALKVIDGGVAGGIAGGVPGGVRRGVTDGVSGGVAGGVRGGVSGGVTSSINGGVPGGMRSGVTGGIPGGIRDGVPGGVDQAVTGEARSSPAVLHERALDAVLESARPRDALTLWHLLSRIEGADRGRVYDRMSVLVPPPTGVTREGALAGDRRMLDLWWDDLGLGVASWWRLWKQPGPPQSRS